MKAELHNVAGYVYRHERAAEGYARFLNSLVFQLVQKWHQNRSIYHGLEVREGNVFRPFSASICMSILTTFLASFFTSVFTLFFMSFFTSSFTLFFMQFSASIFFCFCFMYLAIRRLEARSMVQHVQHVQHVSQPEEPDDSDKYNNRPGDEIP